MVDDLIKAMERAIGELRRWPKEAVQIFHHNDSDGLSSGAILTRAFERDMRYGVSAWRSRTRRFCEEFMNRKERFLFLPTLRVGLLLSFPG
jgi:hypothetical protein